MKEYKSFLLINCALLDYYYHYCCFILLLLLPKNAPKNHTLDTPYKVFRHKNTFLHSKIGYTYFKNGYYYYYYYYYSRTWLALERFLLIPNII
jgi:hypothetical protein